MPNHSSVPSLPDITQVWVIFTATGERRATIDNTRGSYRDVLDRIAAMVMQYDTTIPTDAPHVAHRYILAATAPAASLSDLFRNTIEAPAHG